MAPRPQPLHHEVRGSGSRLVLAHGFTQTARMWGPFGDLLARHHELVAVDLPGHGGSSHVRCGLPEGGALLAAAGGTGPFDLLGYSLGARYALHAVLACPGVVRRLVLIGGTAGIDDPDARDARRRRDESTAAELEESGDVAGFLRRWVRSPMFARLADPGLDERGRNTAAGLASSLRLAGTGAQAPLWDQLHRIAPPTLVVAGAADVRFTAIGDRMVGAMPAATLSLIPGAGHAAHLEQATLTASSVVSFLGDLPVPR
ncbi:MAG: alpha/beta fold hydrolase [Acidimicrobiales bacterium]